MIVDAGHARRGLGRGLRDTALDHCRAQRFERIYLWTFAGLDPARRLYERAGFRLVREASAAQWGKPMTEQRFELHL